MNFQQLEYVLAVSKHGNFGKAAYACQVTQATLSAMIKKLENELGVIIFDRSRQPIQTTERGLQVLTQAEQILKQKSSLESIGLRPLTELKGRIRLGIIPTIANSLLSLILPPILKSNPELNLQVLEITTEEIKHKLLSGEIDLGLLATPLEDDSFDESILYYESMLVYGVKGSTNKFVSSEDISNGKIWLLEEGHCFRSQALTICDIQEKDDGILNLDFEGNSFDTLLNLTDTFGGYTLIPELYYNSMPKSQQKLVKGFQKPIPVREVSLISYRPHAKTQTVNYLTELIGSIVKPLLSTSRYKNQDLDIIGI